MRVWGTVSYEGAPVQEGQIVFFPIEDTRGPSTGAEIREGRYEIPRSDGPRAGGVYRVEITAAGPARSYAPNASGAGMVAEVKGQLLPPAYNQQSKLRAEISPDADENQHDFHLQP